MADTDLLKATTLLDNLGVPNEGRRLVINPNANYNLAIGLRTLSNPNAIPGAFQDKTFNTGNVPSNIFGVETVLVTPSLLYHLVGSHGGATLGVSAAPTEGATSIVLTRTGTSAISSFLRVGDIITFGTAGNANAVYKVNYETKDSFGDLAQFVVTADVDVALNATTVTVPVDPPFRATGDRQNISRMPTASNPVTPVTVAGASGSTYAVNLLTWRQAFIWCSPPQAIMKDRPNLQLSLPEIPFNVRGSYGSDHLGNSETYRYDTLYAVHGYRTEGAVRICGL